MALVSGILSTLPLTQALPAIPVNPYVPIATSCPSGSLIRNASLGLSTDEASYVKARYPLASQSLQTWLNKTNTGFGTIKSYPKLAIAFSGGGYRAQLTGAGVRQGLDSRDSSSGVAGLLQSFTYESGLSGGSWLLGSISGNDYPTVSHLQSTLWGPAAAAGFLLPDGLEVVAADLGITNDVAAKQAAGFTTTIVDIYGRLQGYAFLEGTDGGVSKLFSDVASSANFTAHNVPFPIITALGVDDSYESCEATYNSTQFEFTPYTFGSFDPAIQAFTPTKYLGTTLTNGKTNSSCVIRYDNLGYVMGTSSDVFAAAFCDIIDLGQSISTSNSTAAALLSSLTNLLSGIRNDTQQIVAGTYPNPFYKLHGVAAPYANQRSLDLVDGGTGGQNDPIWPFLHRDVDVLFVSDNSADTNANYPNGSEIRQTYVEAQARRLHRMPYIPPVGTLLARSAPGAPGFFGCNQSDAMTIIWMPNHNWTYASGTSTFQLQYSMAASDAMIANGARVASYNGTADWPACVGCAVLRKTTAALPAHCAQCFAEYCWS